MSQLKDWMKVIPESEFTIYKNAGLLGKLEPGKKAALILTDLTMSSCGSEGNTLEEAQKEHPLACGPVAWETMPRISRLIEVFRAKGLPLVYTHADLPKQLMAGPAAKTKRDISKDDPKMGEFPDIVAPKDGDFILPKTKASAFFQTPLNAFLVRNNVDTVVICGVATSGCIRATALDAFSNGYKTFVVDDCCFDRSYFAHCTNLFDINAKYGSVISLDEVAEIIKE